MREQLEMEEDDEGGVWDDMKGATLNVKDVEAARREEVAYMRKRLIGVEQPR